VRFRRITWLIILVLSCFTVGAAQTSSVENLRSQLSDVQQKETEIQARIRQVEEDIKPENIEKALALNGSTRPEELREQRRRQLESQRTNLQTQLDQLAQSRVRLETAIATAEAAQYQQSALPDSYSPAATVNPGSTTTVRPKTIPRRVRRKTTRRARRRG
jgi:peptidoglycan hydrolase CwlO-like protein